MNVLHVYEFPAPHKYFCELARMIILHFPASRFNDPSCVFERSRPMRRCGEHGGDRDETDRLSG